MPKYTTDKMDKKKKMPMDKKEGAKGMKNQTGKQMVVKEMNKKMNKKGKK